MTYASKRLFITRASFRNDDVMIRPGDVTHGNNYGLINDDSIATPVFSAIDQ